ncbi:adenosine deaminase [Ferrimonas balearica DSM 9799]|uniref:Adenosine deaminase n=2 Tax=Ferrimonas balearica TaxID=44012 RepID=E1SVQ3_FERBD|nr:adenosine deaminase [Ferrimonas balearica]ADN76384.1 adenosine deaminase [Ferrimonas balearica DSM 9799]MBW3139290.1 adenosine deaminase [Ferrimonas balearica]MBW3163120.1 adenosine deaminase [Ferrimonas balearica]MBY6016867.1 adenosine deaminase [Halomonas denitrificans]
MIDTSLPLVDLHRHLDGNIRPRTIWELGQQHNLVLPADRFEALIPHVQITDNAPDLVTFLAKLDWGVAVLKDYDAVRRVAYENAEDLKLNGIDYAELRFSPAYMAMTHGLEPEGVVEAVVDGVQAGCRDFGVKAKLIGILSRTFGADACHAELQACLAFRDKLTAMDLAGDELGQPGPQFEDHFRIARDAGFRLTIHAGEAAGPESIWHAVRELGAERIGHGVKAVQDPALMDYLVEHGIALESCLTSNVQTTTVANLADHPITTFLKHGITVTLNTDDPGVEGVDLGHEYEVAAPAAGLSAQDCRTLQENGLKAAFLSERERDELRQAKRA